MSESYTLGSTRLASAPCLETRYNTSYASEYDALLLVSHRENPDAIILCYTVLLEWVLVGCVYVRMHTHTHPRGRPESLAHSPPPRGEGSTAP